MNVRKMNAQSDNATMSDKEMKHYRLDRKVISRIEKECVSTGRTATRVIEDAILRRHTFRPYVEELIQRKAQETGWTYDHVLEWAVLAVLGDRVSPDLPAEAHADSSTRSVSSSRASAVATASRDRASELARAGSSRESGSADSTARKSRRASTAPKKS